MQVFADEVNAPASNGDDGPGSAEPRSGPKLREKLVALRGEVEAFLVELGS